MENKFSLKQFGVSLGYDRIKKLGDKLDRISDVIDWDRLRKYFNENAKVGRPPYDPILMIKLLALQSWYGISDQELEYQVADRLSFQKFLGFLNEVPDFTTIWRFRDELSKEDIIDNVWQDIEEQMKEKGIKFSKGVIQDAQFVTADPGKTNSGMNNRGRGQPTTRNEDGTWTKKGKKSFFGYKKHVKVDKDNGIIRRVAITTASTADCNLDLTEPDETVYRDKGYYGTKTRAKGNATMDRASKNKPLTIRQKLRNRRITRKRSPGERQFAVMTRTMNGGHTLLTELHRVFVQQVMCCITFNLMQMKRILQT